MIYRNQAGQGIFLYAYTIATGLGKSGDAANITGYNAHDGGAVDVFDTANPSEVSAANMPGTYWQPLAQAETDGGAIAAHWKSVTAGVAIDPVQILTAGVDVRYVGGSPSFATDGTLAAGSASTVTFPATDSAGNAIPDDGRYAYALVQIVEGAGSGQFVSLGASSGSRVYAVVPGTMPVPCNNTSKFVVLGTTNANVTPGGLNLITNAELTAAPTNFPQKLMWLYQRLAGRVSKSPSNILVKTAAGATATTQTTTDDGAGNQTQGIVT